MNATKTSHREVIWGKGEMIFRVREIKLSAGYVKGSVRFKITRPTFDSNGNYATYGFHTVTWETES